MEKKLVNFFTKNKIKPTDILYILKEDRHTLLKLKNGDLLQSYIPVKYFLSTLPDGAYLNITKGIIISAGDIEKIEGNLYTMCDGKTFSGRIRAAGEHKTNRQILEKKMLPTNRLISETVFQQFSIMDQLPLPFCVVELVFNDSAHNVDFIFRYCNEAMAQYEGCLREELLDRPYDEIFKRVDKKWALAYMEVALTGIPCYVKDIHPKTKKELTVHCFQPRKNLCACLLVESE